MPDIKSEILTALRQSRNYISGQDLSEQLHVSRTAVWKHIQKLQEEGYDIEAVPNRGYRMISCPDTIASGEVVSRMTTRWIGKDIRYFAQIDSTNQYIKRIAEEGAPEGILAIADEQTAGRGRLGRSWSTPPKTAVAMSLLLRPTIPVERISMVTLIMGLAISQGCRELYPALDVGIKWPNDAVVNGKKISGTLTEMSTDMESVLYIVVGTGINVNVKTFPEEIRETATSIALELGEDQNRAQLIAVIMKHFEDDYERFLKTQDLSLLMDEYNRQLLNKGRKVRVLQPGHEYTGEALGINKMGDLLVKKEEGTVEAVYAGEVSVRGVYGYV